jgi:hypothetical protein
MFLLEELCKSQNRSGTCETWKPCETIAVEIDEKLVWPSRLTMSDPLHKARVSELET